MPPDFIKESELWGPLFALGVLGAVLIAAGVVHVAFQTAVSKRWRITPEGLDISTLAAIRGPIVLVMAILGLFLGFLALEALTIPELDFLNGTDELARKAWTIVLILQVTQVATRLAQSTLIWYLSRLTARLGAGMNERLLPPIRRVLPAVIYAVGILVILDTVGVSISPLLAGLGIGGLAAALAIQPTLSNFFAGTYIITEGNVKVGDYLELQGIVGGPIPGYVTEVGWRSTKLRNRQNNLVIVPNSTIASAIIVSYVQPTPSVTVRVECGVSYDSDLARVERVVEEVAQEVVSRSPHAAPPSHPEVGELEPHFGFSAFGESNIEFWVALEAKGHHGGLLLKSELIKRLHDRFDKEGIEINYPVRKLVGQASNGKSQALQARQS